MSILRNTLPCEEKVEIVISSANEKLTEYCVDILENSASISMVINKTKEFEPSSNETASTSSNGTIEAIDEEKKLRHLQLYRAAMNDDWNKAEQIFNKYPKDITAPISKKEDTALHIAATTKTSRFAKKLVGKMKEEDLEKKNKDKNTAFCLAAASGKLELIDVMRKKNANLVNIRGNKNFLPLHLAALFGHKKMVQRLYEVTDHDSLKDDLREFLVTLIDSEFYDIALDMVIEHSGLAIPKENELTALHALARIPMTTSNFADQGILKSCFNLFSATNMYHKKKLHPQAIKLIKHLWSQVIVLDDSRIAEIIRTPWPLIFVAARQGNVEFLTILIHEYPDLILKVDNDDYSIFHHAVLCRQENIFKLIYEVGSIKDFIVPIKDKHGNNILHLAGMLAPPDRLNIVSGAALQMQRELLWFEEVRKNMNVLDTEEKNKRGLTPRALFTKEHSDLKKNGETWMKDTANSCMIVATLIATVVFAAAFTVPGGTREDSGSPNFLRAACFTVFAIFNAISLVSSSCSILTFLSILTSRYAEEDFIWRLPTKLLVGVTTLFVSIIAMMVVFSATYFIVFNDGLLGCAVLISSIASMPVFLFIFLQSHLFVDVFRSTYFSSHLFQPK